MYANVQPQRVDNMSPWSTSSTVDNTIDFRGEIFEFKSSGQSFTGIREIPLFFEVPEFPFETA